ncbi:MAG: hypothetical protein JW751_04300 [Polyangiaceae bacterium]|nr:hypothetical protein [Polyangiaceae bacterium]
MDGTRIRMLVRLAAFLPLMFAPACGPEGLEGPQGTGVASGTSGGSGTGGDYGPGSGGAIRGSGGMISSSGGVGSGIGGSGSGIGGGGPGSGGNGPGTGGSGPGTGGSGPGAGGSGSGIGGSGPGAGGSGPGTGGSGSGIGGSGPGTGGSGPGSGGSGPGTGGSGSGIGGSGPATGGTGGGASTFAVNVELSTAIPTVGITTWSLDAPVDSATIEFGRDPSSFELEAPVDLEASDHRTLLLGMKQDTTYYVRVTATGGGQTYVSDVASIKTGYLANGLPIQTVTDHDASALYAGGGFTTTCTGFTVGSGERDSSALAYAFIFDRDGDVVWAYDLSNSVAATCTRARMSIDGKYMWIGNFGNTTPDGALTRLSMDGLGTPKDFSLPGRSHDFAILPNEHIVYFGRDDGGSGMTPESIMELDPETGSTTLIYRELTDFGQVFDERGGHTNQVNYVPELNAISFSMYFINTIAVISYPAGQLLATFGGDNSTFPNLSWNGQHGHDLFADHIAIFNNNGENAGSSVLRYQYDLQARTATAEPTYSPGVASIAFGDVKELPNGNYFVTYSTASTMHEIGPSMNLLREVDTTVTIGYSEHRPTLYGPPPPYGP